jgi:hypothetical protein
VNTLTAAEHAIEKGLSILLVKEGEKTPAYRFKDTPPLTMDQLRKLY